jgi:5-methylcytosine-specific restriction endonuclease McrA
MPPTPATVLPLEELPDWMQVEIQDAVAAPRPPRPVLSFGGFEIPSRAWHEWYWQRGVDPYRRPRRARIPLYLREAVLARDGLVCRLCGGAVEPHDVHLDHRVPVAAGGQTTLTNLQVAHSICNRKKGASI